MNFSCGVRQLPAGGTVGQPWGMGEVGPMPTPRILCARKLFLMLPGETRASLVKPGVVARAFTLLA